ncbi:MAG: glycosyltransferase family 2 protein [Ramlibacter sp.]
MCVYNGAPYLPRQLQSILAQTELPAAMVVLDDGSSDGSWDLLQAWAASAPFPVNVERNAQRLGVPRNFERAAGLLRQDIIFLADQDDAWYPTKLAMLVDHFAADPALTLLHTDAELVDGDDRPLGRTLLAALLVSPRERASVAAGAAYQVYARRNLVTGATCAFRRSLLVQAVPFSERLVHDDWLAFIAALVGKVEMLDTPTMQYRLHGANTIGLPLPTVGWRIRNTLESLGSPAAPRHRQRAERLEEVIARARALGSMQGVVDDLSSAAAHARFRAALPRNAFKRVACIARERAVGQYTTWSSGWLSVVHDLLIAG